MTRSLSYDVLILGAGPGGYVAAIRCAQLGLKTALIEDQHLGGVCLNWGCIPTKTLLRTSELYHMMGQAKSFGITVSGLSFDLAKIVARSREIAHKLSKGIHHLMKKNKVDVYEGWGVLQAPEKGIHHLKVMKGEAVLKNLQGNHVILAPGAKARELPDLASNGTSVWNVRQAMTPTALPKTMAIIGSGAIGVEFASFYKALGVDVTLIEMQRRILPQEDEEISDLAQKSFEKQGIKILTQCLAKVVSLTETSVSMAFSSPKGEETQSFHVVLPAVGIVGNTQGYGLEATKVQVDKGHIVTDSFCHTHEPGIYAIGDVTQGPWLAHKASHEGIMVAEKIAGLNPQAINSLNIPGCTYSYPQIASVGLTETQAKALGYPVRVGRFPFMANGKAMALGETEGLIKVIYHDHSGELLGAHMLGSEVTEMIQGFVIAKTAECTEETLMHTIFPHPTLSEMMPEAVLDAYGQSLHY
jgi:dihydrolipoamide dehydrogenase